MAIPTGTVIPKSGGAFVKLEEGANKFRFLSDVRVGWEGWKDNKPFRHEGAECKIPSNIVDLNKNQKPNINYFWVALVWSYEEERVMILELTQKTIMNALYDYEQNPNWGDLKEYDMIINKKKEGDKVSYSVQVIPPRDVSADIIEAYKETELATTIEEMFDYEPIM